VQCDQYEEGSHKCSAASTKKAAISAARQVRRRQPLMLYSKYECKKAAISAISQKENKECNSHNS